MNITPALIFVVLLCITLPAHAYLTVEAEGSARIINGDLISARQSAIAQAAEAAAMRSGSYVSTTSVLNQGRIDIDNVRLSAVGRVSGIQVINERIIDNMLLLRIRATLDMEEGCSNEIDELAYKRKVAFAAFPLMHPAQANTGNLHNLPRQLPDLLAQQLLQQPGFETLLTTRLNIHPDLNNAPTQTLDTFALSNHQSNTELTDAQYIVSGVIRDLRPLNPAGAREPNLFQDTYYRLNKNHQHHQRIFSFDVFIHDAISGGLIFQQSYNITGIWNSRKTQMDFASQAFWELDYGQKVANLLRQASLDIRDQLRCEPFSARIIQTDAQRIWINAGQLSGLKPGDRLSIFRRNIHYDVFNQAQSEFLNTGVTLTLDQVHPTRASGTIHQHSGDLNIQRDDIVRSH